VWRYALLAGPALIAACASAGSGGIDQVPPDAAPPADTPPPIDTPPVDVCPSADTCAAALMLGQVSGDTGNQMLTAMGHQAAWFHVRVTEDNNDIIGLTLRAAARLTSPAAVDFDVFVYVGAGSTAIECTTTAGTTTTNGAVNETRVEWGEGAIPNGVNDGRTISIEVRPISGTCAPGQVWQLVVEGNWD
jgi:hypothetical protein